MITVRVNGGLGNQMFQYAFGYYLENVGNDVCYDLSDFLIHHHHQGYELERVFNIHVKEPNRKETIKLYGNKNSILLRLFQKITNMRIISKNEIIDDGSIFYILPTIINNSLYFNGFWQNIKYVQPNIKYLQNIFLFKDLDGNNKKLISEKGNSVFVGIHVRRGDYLNIACLNDVCNSKYYESAIDYIKKKVNNPRFIIFSDDITWCKTAFENYDCVFVDWNRDDNSYKDMQLMSLCDHMIIANSTFSWWGAMLIKNEKAIKIAPSSWNKNIKTNFLIDESWVILDTEK